jgi:hypothetical protein
MAGVAVSRAGFVIDPAERATPLPTLGPVAVEFVTGV